MIQLTPQQYEELQQVVDWETASPLPDGRLLGNAEKRGCLIPASDPRIAAVRESFGDSLESILELGPCEGYFTVQLAPLCKRLVAIEARPKNIVCTLIRLFCHEIKNVELLMKDVRELDDGFGRFDLLFHSGVLYHLADPVEHLFRIRKIADRLYLDTHYLSEDDPRFPRADVHYQGKCYRAAQWTEAELTDIWSGLQKTSRILYLDSLLELLNDLGFDSIRVVHEGNVSFAPRVGLIAARSEKVPQKQESRDALIEILRRELAAARQEISLLREAELQMKVGQQVKGRSLASRVIGRARRALSRLRNLVFGGLS